MIKGFFFDFYDTLCYVKDDVYVEGKHKIAEHFSVSFEEFFKAWRATGMDSIIGKLKNSEERIAAVAKKLNVTISEDLIKELADMDRKYLEKGSELYPNTAETLKTLRTRGFKLGIISNASDTVEILSRKFNLPDYFDVINFSYALGTKKPDPEIYTSALSALKLTSEESVFTGDGNDNELDAAFDLGFKTVLIDQVRNDRFRHADSTKYHHRINNISEILQIINEE